MYIFYGVLFAIGLTFMIDALIERMLNKREREQQIRDRLKKFITDEFDRQGEDK